MSSARHLRSLLLALSLATGATAAGCANTHEAPIDLPAPGESAEALIGPEGGDVTVGTVTLHVPAGALDEPVMIRAVVTDAAPPSLFTAYSPVIRFEPEGLEFDAPVELRIPFSGDGRAATVFWSAQHGDAFVPRRTRVEGAYAIAESTHFSEAFVGSACEGDCCDQANGELDVLFVVDNSNSMTEEQATLVAQLPRIARALATGDSDGDGVQDFPAIESLRVGVTTTDMGVGGQVVPTCSRADFGDDGLLLGGREQPGCTGMEAPIAAIGADATAAEIDAFVQHVSCNALRGIGGCGFEQPLEATLKALSPATAQPWTSDGYSPPTFFGDTSGHGRDANAGLVREDSILTVLMLTDEEDCSLAPDYVDLVNPSSETYGSVDLNLRCFQFPETQWAITRFSSGLVGLRRDPADLVFATITGIPTDAEGEPLDAVLAHPDMAERIDLASPTRLMPSCSTPNGLAFPPTRIVRVAQEIEAAGGSSVVGSICSSDYGPTVQRILERVAARASGVCTGG